MARSGGRLLLFGIHTATEGALPFYQLYLKELALFNGRAAKSEDFPNAIDLVQTGTIQLEPLISRVMPLSALNTAIGTMISPSSLKIILEHA